MAVNKAFQGVSTIIGSAYPLSSTTVYSYQTQGYTVDKPIQSLANTTFIDNSTSGVYSADYKSILGDDQPQGENGRKKTFIGELSTRSYPVPSGYDTNLKPDYGDGRSSTITTIGADSAIPNTYVTYTIGGTPAATQII